ncbi:hypothetical protein CONPUDRAFT_160612 [Coniophora puteana RWD-64-598 SS2]|uniref:Uncharacterized protein n=1 Tax=Coniophora puteana (strain RWD-64-598) TaxID=741705 RepID=R7SFL5_CONPW|nr:uncharacterized protein CONPUDRAFT_160612 [Coniophora puteana RWD-64-598 SS2]EIW73874.1 hypothetical protein CONPUDRAFT_160612 [Coniophora puteana RWD-64-598 SS2]
MARKSSSSTPTTRSHSPCERPRKKRRTSKSQPSLSPPPSPPPSKSPQKAGKSKSAPRKTKKKRAKVGHIKSLSIDDQCLRLSRVFARTGGLMLEIESALQLGVWKSLEGTHAFGEISPELQEQWEKMSKGWQDWHLWIFEFVKEHCTHIYRLIEQPDKLDELTERIRKMQVTAGQTRNDDFGHFRECICLYAADNVEVPILPFVGKGSPREKMGFNHPVFARLLCPAIYLEEFDTNPTDFSRQFRESTTDFKATATWLPTLVWEPGTYNKEKVSEGMFLHPVIIRCLKRMLLGPEAAKLSTPYQAKNGSNCSLMEVYEVRREHIAYATMGARCAMSGQPQWGGPDIDYDWEDAHNNILEFLWRFRNKDFVNGLLRTLNTSVFGHPKGRKRIRATTTDEVEAYHGGDFEMFEDQEDASTDCSEDDPTTDNNSPHDAADPNSAPNINQDEAPDKNSLAPSGPLRTKDSLNEESVSANPAAPKRPTRTLRPSNPTKDACAPSPHHPSPSQENTGNSKHHSDENEEGSEGSRDSDEHESEEGEDEVPDEEDESDKSDDSESDEADESSESDDELERPPKTAISVPARFRKASSTGRTSSPFSYFLGAESLAPCAGISYISASVTSVALACPFIQALVFLDKNGCQFSDPSTWPSIIFSHNILCHIPLAAAQLQVPNGA